MAKKKVAPPDTNGVLIKAAATIGKAAGKLAALVTSRSKATKQEERTKPTKSRVRKSKSGSRKKTSPKSVASTKARKTTKKRSPKG